MSTQQLRYDFLDEIDKQDIEEMYDDYTINQLDSDNVKKIYNYLLEQGIEFAKDILIERLELFLINSEEFIQKFEKIKQEIGTNYIEEIEENKNILEKIY